MPTTRIDSQDVKDTSVSGADIFTGSQGQVLMMTGTTPTWRWPDDALSAVSVASDDWIGGTWSGSLGWVASISPSGSLISLDVTAPDSNHPGVVSLSTGTTATGKSALIVNSASIVFGSGVAVAEALIRLPTLSSAAERFNCFVGFGDNATSGAMVDGLYARYGDELNGGQWQLLLANNSAITIVNTAMSASVGAWTRLRFETNALATTGTLYVNGAQAAQVSGSFPNTTARATGLVLKIQKTAGLNSRTLLCDYFMFAKSVTR